MDGVRDNGSNPFNWRWFLELIPAETPVSRFALPPRPLPATGLNLTTILISTHMTKTPLRICAPLSRELPLSLIHI